MPRIDGKRLLADLQHIRGFGRFETGVHRPTFSPEDVAARQWLAGRMAEAGLAPSIDGVGNVLGRSPAAGPCLLMGSHTDTQPRGGWLDGVMGVIYGLEAARAFAEEPAAAGLSIDVASWADEESHYLSFLGSRSFVGQLPEAEIDNAKHREDGTPLRQAIAQAGFAGRPRLTLEEGRYRGYLEAHIEQGGSLETDGKRIGVVTSIVGIFQYRMTFEGRQNHAGTTPMPIRKDSGVALVRLLAQVNDRFAAIAGPRTVWTAGRILLHPGAPSIIPGKAEVLLQFRDGELTQMQRMEEELVRLVAEANAMGPCAVSLETLSRTPPTAMDARLQDAVAAAAEAHAPRGWMRMPSGAGHDAQILARRLPAGMLFVPSIGGVSHHYSEDTAEADLVLGCQVFCDAAFRFLKA
ncbi:MAG: Zn-dependent hydrolase [Alphaproteobacteria bacterium]|nr:Zn-dependent hydrolase [Alphaproteobacteria bacterium]